MKGTLVTGDAIFTQRDLSEQILKDGGDYLWTVKDNQKSLRTEIENTFEGEALPPRENDAPDESAHGGDDRQGAWPLGEAAH